MNRILGMLLLLLFKWTASVYAQNYYYIGSGFAHNVNFNNSICNCSIEAIGPTDGYSGGITYSPEGVLYYLGGIAGGSNAMYSVDPLTGDFISLIMVSPPYMPPMNGFVCLGNGLFLSYPFPSVNSDSIYLWNVNTTFFYYFI